MSETKIHLLLTYVEELIIIGSIISIEIFFSIPNPKSKGMGISLNGLATALANPNTGIVYKMRTLFSAFPVFIYGITVLVLLFFHIFMSSYRQHIKNGGR